MIFYADGDKKQTLIEHIRGVREKAQSFSSDFECGSWGGLLGDWHDLGKFMVSFQVYMLEDAPMVEHAVVGGRHSIDAFPEDSLRRIALQFCITCHHTGLQSSSHIQERLRKASGLVSAAIKNIPEELLKNKLPEWPDWLVPPSSNSEKIEIDKWKRSLEFWIRMLHSCLVDADWLDAEKRDSDYPLRPEFPSISILRGMFDQQVDEIVTKAKNENWTPVNKQREIVLKACRAAAETEVGLFSLTVPTGGGKTFSAMSFALNHAVKNELNRIIIVIPYTSIIKQNSNVYAEIFGQKNVIEHHSNLTPKKDTETNRLASENWDAPIVVTTSVQFFESLHACKTSRCRKLHNIANSVVVFDEAQCLPPEFLRPAVFAIRELHRHYGVTPVLCTATQPVLTKTESFDFKFKEGFGSVVEIVGNPESLFGSLGRVRVEVFNELAPVTYEAIAETMQAEEQSVLCIVNKKDGCRTLAKLLPEEQTIHLSTNMCAEHRFQTLEKIRERLSSAADPFYVVSTSLVEAGVDLDFPVVYRALAGLDSIAQA
ncbi:CRISPR-associated endonuclease Cas3'', partial [bacterium]|nr:CRISPR-associated endonuclease Cas3'' [bacterium]